MCVKNKMVTEKKQVQINRLVRGLGSGEGERVCTNISLGKLDIFR